LRHHLPNIESARPEPLSQERPATSTRAAHEFVAKDVWGGRERRADLGGKECEAAGSTGKSFGKTDASLGNFENCDRVSAGKGAMKRPDSDDFENSTRGGALSVGTQKSATQAGAWKTSSDQWSSWHDDDHWSVWREWSQDSWPRKMGRLEARRGWDSSPEDVRWASREVPVESSANSAGSHGPRRDAGKTSSDTQKGKAKCEDTQKSPVAESARGRKGGKTETVDQGSDPTWKSKGGKSGKMSQVDGVQPAQGRRGDKARPVVSPLESEEEVQDLRKTSKGKGKKSEEKEEVHPPRTKSRKGGKVPESGETEDVEKGKGKSNSSKIPLVTKTEVEEQPSPTDGEKKGRSGKGARRWAAAETPDHEDHDAQGGESKPSRVEGRDGRKDVSRKFEVRASHRSAEEPEADEGDVKRAQGAKDRKWVPVSPVAPAPGDQ